MRCSEPLRTSRPVRSRPHRLSTHRAQVAPCFAVTELGVVRRLSKRHMKPFDIIGVWCVSIWVVAALCSWLLRRQAKTAEAKRAIHRKLAFISGGFILAIACLFVAAGLPPAIFLLMVPAAVIITFMKLRSTRFCPGCTRTVYNPVMWRRLDFCPYCGAKLDSNEPNVA